ncbi:acetate/propionate family kinase [Chiayiivirga flava]|uniref:Acetate kinase n=1 Tax=Chiayiivirga flava TaxID=659595 RepID=A0A7W8D227_9GAMM|nr:acetate/propionate family kinase [Chiayiivirga flava]MBB5206545.1 acetate kinase [Chiayiivirga flava]
MSAGRWALALNCGSSSIKFALFDARAEPMPETAAWRGEVEGIGTPQATLREGAAATPLPAGAASTFACAVQTVCGRVDAWLGGRPLAYVAHRVVHGGGRFAGPVRVDAGVLAALRAVSPMAPLHQPAALDAIETFLRQGPDLPQVAGFDTAFHATLPAVETMLPLPPMSPELRRYGFHGLSYDYVAHRLRRGIGSCTVGRVIVAHLGNGASLCALRNLRSVATTMGFSALDGLMMGTRCGSIDPGLLLHLLEHEGYTPRTLADLLYHRAGLLGVSGLSADLRQLLAPDAGRRAQDAVALYVHRIVREIGAMTAVLGGLDMLVFTAGVGEHSAEVRSRVCDRLGHLGLRLDAAANAGHRATISAYGSRVRACVVRTNEEWILATQARAALAATVARTAVVQA